MNAYDKPLEWVPNPRAGTIANSPAVSSTFPDGVFEEARSFHRQIPGYRPSPLRNLSSLAAMLSVGAQGNVRTQTLRAFSPIEMGSLLDSMG